MGFRTRTITAATACAPWKGRMILPAWQRSCDAAEFSQENAFEAVARYKATASVAEPEDGKRGACPTNEKQAQSYVRLPDLIIVDGGKGQLSSACRELQRLGLHNLPIIGLAKEHE